MSEHNVVTDILRYSVGANERTIEKVFGQCTEELGEVATAYFRPHKAKEPAFDEVVDLIVAAVDLAYLLAKRDNPNITKEEIYEKIAKIQIAKCNKWWFSDLEI